MTLRALLGSLVVAILLGTQAGAEDIVIIASTAPSTAHSTSLSSKLDAIKAEIQRRRQTNPAAAEVLATDLQAALDRVAQVQGLVPAGKRPATNPSSLAPQ